MKNRLAIYLLALLANCGAVSLLASVTTFEFAGSLYQEAGASGLKVGDSFVGSFSYTLEQEGTDVPLIIAGQETRYILDRYTLTIQEQTLTATGGRIEIGNDELPWPEQYPQIMWDLVALSLGKNAGTALSCSVSGVPVSDLSFSLVNTVGRPFSDTSLPTTLCLSDFLGSAYIDIGFDNQGGSAFGQITSLQVVPEPGLPGLAGLAAVLFGFRFASVRLPKREAGRRA